MTATYVGRAWSCDVRLVVEDDSALDAATEDLTDLLSRVDGAASRFRPDSALSIANARAGRRTAIPTLLADLIAAALGAAARTDGAVDPTLGLAMQRIGYDRDIGNILGAVGDTPVPVAAPAPHLGWRDVVLHRGVGLLTVPDGTALDLGATAKAWTVDRAARTLAARYGTGVLVEIGGDLAVAGHRPGGWAVRVAERAGGPGQIVRITCGGLATSTTTVRHWLRAGRHLHHIVDPSTGEPADGPWRTASVFAPSALLANAASTAVIVRGAGAVDRLREQRLAARLVGVDGDVVTTEGWPEHGVRPRGSRRSPVSSCVPARSIVVGPPR